MALVILPPIFSKATKTLCATYERFTKKADDLHEANNQLARDVHAAKVAPISPAFFESASELQGRRVELLMNEIGLRDELGKFLEGDFMQGFATCYDETHSEWLRFQDRLCDGLKQLGYRADPNSPHGLPVALFVNHPEWHAYRVAVDGAGGERQEITRSINQNLAGIEEAKSHLERIKSKVLAAV